MGKMGKTKPKTSKKRSRAGGVAKSKGPKPGGGSKKLTSINNKLGKMAKRGKLKGKGKQKLFTLREKRNRKMEQKRLEVSNDCSDSRQAMIEQEEAVFEITTASQPAKRQNIEQIEDRKRARMQLENETKIEMKQMLPIKLDNGHVQTVQTEAEDVALDEESADNSDVECPDALSSDEDAETDEIQNTNTNGQHSQSEPSVSLEDHVEASAFDAHLDSVPNCKLRIANLCQQIMAEPETQVSKLKQLLWLADGSLVEDASVKLITKRLTVLSLAQVFVDIIPGYKLRNATEHELTKIKKETKQLLEYEEALLRYYRQYLQLLEANLNQVLGQQNRSKKQNAKREQMDAKLLHVSVQCLCDLLTKCAHFNYAPNLVSLIVRLTSVNNHKVSALCCECLKGVLAGGGVGGQTALDITRCVNRMVASGNHIAQTIQPQLIYALLALKIREVEKPQHKSESAEEKMKRKAERKLMNKKSKKYKKQLDALENELRETEAQQDRQTRLKTNTAIMKQVFHIYFRVLRRAPKSKLLRPTLQGLSKFAHLINIEFYDDLIGSLYALVEEHDLHTLDSLHAVHTVFQLLSGEGQSINTDPSRFYQSMFKLLPRIALETNQEYQQSQWSVCMKSLDIMLVQRRKLISIDRLAAFIKRISLLCLLSVHTAHTRCLLAAIRSYLMVTYNGPWGISFVAIWMMLHKTHSKLLSLVELDEEESVGGGGCLTRRFVAALNDPEHCNALATDLKELTVFNSHPDSIIRSFVTNIMNGVPLYGALRMKPEYALMKPWEFLSMSVPDVVNTNQLLLPLRKHVLNIHKLKAKQFDLEDEQELVRHSAGVCAIIQEEYIHYIL